MHVFDQQLRLSAGDLGKELACRHLIELDRGHAEGRLRATYYRDERLERLKERGREHEEKYVAHLAECGRDVVDLNDFKGEGHEQRVAEAMRAGVDVIVQAKLSHARWMGYADILVRIDAPSDLGAWSYEIIDTKLAQETRAATILQLCLYNELLGRIQRRIPERFGVVKPGDGEAGIGAGSGSGFGFVAEWYRFADFHAYYRHVKRQLEATIDRGASDDTYPYPVSFCNICRWAQDCRTRRRDDDHVSLVAGIRSLQTRELERQGVFTLEQFADAPKPLPEKPSQGSLETFEFVQAQARVQVRGRREDAHVSELIEFEPGRGLARLPAPDAADVFFDIEGDHYVEHGGLEYLFGYACFDVCADAPADACADPGGPLVYHRLWALDHAAEKQAFERFVDFVMARWAANPGMHVYHYAHYEPAAVKRLAMRHATREDQVDQLLRGERFIDLYGVVRQGVRASVERYSIKDLEPFFGYVRSVEMPDANSALRRVECALELGTPGETMQADRDLVEGYNRDDCLATEALRGWLEDRRDELMTLGHDVERPARKDGTLDDDADDRSAATRALFEKLVNGLPEDRDTWGAAETGRWLLAHLLEYFWRERKVSFWEFYALQDLGHDDCFGDRNVAAGLAFIGDGDEPTKRCASHRYRFPTQEITIKEGSTLYVVGGDREKVGKLQSIDHAAQTFDILKMMKTNDLHPRDVFGHADVRPGVLVPALHAIAESVAEQGLDGPGPYRAARDLLLRRAPRLRDAGTGPLRRDGETTLDTAVRLGCELDHGVLAIQGPPGTGKTYTGGHMIASLAAAGKRVGVTAVSHKVIGKLLESAIDAAGPGPFCAVQKVRDESEHPRDGIEETTDNDAALAALDDGKVVGGTAWLWARDEAAQTLDYLFVDEAGQMSLAMVLAAARSARNIVLLGDPQQLEQPQQGAHPEGADVAALVHLLGERQTIAEDQGLFLDTTWRLPPPLCVFTSEVFYDGRLESRPQLARQVLAGDHPFAGSGLFYVPVAHEGNQNKSIDEVAAVAHIVEMLIRPGVTWTDQHGDSHQVERAGFRIVAPYNAQVAALRERLPGVQIGTVDKFQGQEAPIVIYSVATSSAADAPRGLGFLYSPNRLNVATSRARCACILVASPGVFEAECRTPEEMRWVNGLCRFRELASVVEPLPAM